MNIEGEIMTIKEFLLQVPQPESTSTYKCVSHGTLMELTLNAIESCGFQLEKEIYTQSRGGLKANGKYLIKYGNDPDMSIMIAWQNSYDKSLSLKFAIGTWVFICENGACSGNMGAFRSKHIGDVQEITPATIKEFVCGSGEVFYKMVDTKERMKELTVTTRETAELLGRLYVEKEIINSTQLNTIKREIDTPTYNYGPKDTVWTLYNYCTFAMKDCNPQHWLESQRNLHQFFVDEFNIEESID